MNKLNNIKLIIEVIEFFQYDFNYFEITLKQKKIIISIKTENEKLKQELSNLNKNIILCKKGQ